MSDLLLYALGGVAVAFGTLGGIYRVVDPDGWPWWLDGLASASWYVLAAIGGAVAVGLLQSDDEESDSIGTADTDPQIDNPTDVSPDDYERPPVEEDSDAPTPDSGDDLDGDYWSDAHRRGTDGE